MLPPMLRREHLISLIVALAPSVVPSLALAQPAEPQPPAESGSPGEPSDDGPTDDGKPADGDASDEAPKVEEAPQVEEAPKADATNVPDPVRRRVSMLGSGG